MLQVNHFAALTAKWLAFRVLNLIQLSAQHTPTHFDGLVDGLVDGLAVVIASRLIDDGIVDGLSHTK